MKVKCPTCGTMNEKTDTEKVGSRYYCKSCGENKSEEVNANKDGWDELFEYICKLYDIKKPTGAMFKQLGEFRNEPYKYSNTGMYLTLKYFHDVLDNPVLEGSGIGIIPYMYEQAKQHFIEIMNVDEYMENFKPHEETKNIKIKLFDEKFQKVKQLSFGNIAEGEINVEDD